MGESQITFQVRNQIIARTDTFRVVAKSHDYLQASFDFLTEDWQEVNAKTAIFTGVDGKAYEVLIGEDGTCAIPWECIVERGYMFVSVYGGSLITVNKAKVYIEDSGYTNDTENGLENTPSMAEQIMGYFDETIATVADNSMIAQEASTEAQGCLSQIQNTITDIVDYANKAEEYMNNALEYKDLIESMLDEIRSLADETKRIADFLSGIANSVHADASSTAQNAEIVQNLSTQVGEAKNAITGYKAEIEEQLRQANEIRLSYGNGGTFDDWKD